MSFQTTKDTLFNLHDESWKKPNLLHEYCNYTNTLYFTFKIYSKLLVCVFRFYLIFTITIFSHSGRLHSRADKPGGPPTTSLMGGLTPNSTINSPFNRLVRFTTRVIVGSLPFLKIQATWKNINNLFPFNFPFFCDY